MGYRQPYTDPALVVEIHGNKCTLRKQDGKKLTDIHLEDVILVPENARNLEKDPLIFDEDNEKEVLLDSVDERRSPGEMLEDRGNRVKEQTEAFEKEEKRKTLSPGKLEKLQTGNFVVYLLPGRVKECTVSKVTAISRAKAVVVVHRYRAITDNHLRLY